MTNDPALLAAFPSIPGLDAAISRCDLDVAMIRGAALRSGELVSILRDPHSREPESLKRAIRNRKRKLYREILKSWQPQGRKN